MGQFEKMKALLDAAMADGAFGLSSMLMMPPAARPGRALRRPTP